jgi:hypothetical protein
MLSRNSDVNTCSGELQKLDFLANITKHINGFSTKLKGKPEIASYVHAHVKYLKQKCYLKV